MQTVHKDSSVPAGIGDVIDIGGSNLDILKHMLEQSLLEKNGGQQPLLPSAVMSDDVGLKIWSEITHSSEYYQTRDEIELLKQHGPEIAQHIPSSCTVIDLGSGFVVSLQYLRKVQPLLDAIEAVQNKAEYYALDLSKESLERGMELLTPKYDFVRCSGLWGRFEDGMVWSKGVNCPKWFLSLGSIFGNAPFDDAVAGLSKWARVMQPEDRMLLAMDAHTDHKIIWNSYHDSQGLYERFVRNGLARSNEILGHAWCREEDWEINGRLQEAPLMHRTVITAVGDVPIGPLGMRFAAGDEIHCDGAYKYGPAIMDRIFAGAGLRQITQWKAPYSPIYEYLLALSSNSLKSDG